MSRFGRKLETGYEKPKCDKYSLRISISCALVASWTTIATTAPLPNVFASPWQPHTVQQHRDGALVDISASAQIPTCRYHWGHSFAYMPDKNRLLLGTTVGLYSDDLGTTWTETGSPPGQVTYFGGGTALARGSSAISQTNDYGVTWQVIASVPRLPDGEIAHGSFGPMLLDKDPSTGRILRLADAVFNREAFVRLSADGGLTWPTVMKTPWISETVLVRAGNGDIVAATRTDGNASIPNPPPPPNGHRWGEQYDYFSGLGVHVSKDNGYTWSPVNTLYAFGRHHASVVLMPNNNLVMSYVVRLGYDDTPDNLPRYGIEAVVSNDHGQTWDLNHRYIIDQWNGEWSDQPGGAVRLMAPNETYTVLLPDESLMTAYGKAFPGGQRGVQLVRWRLKE